jgi:hypothetical protein
MKNFDEFSKGIKLNESELKVLNEEDENYLEELVGNIVTYLEDHDIKSSHKTNPDKSVDIEVGGEVYNIKKEGDKFIMMIGKQPETFTSSELISWWSSFVPEHKAGEAEYNLGEDYATSSYGVLKVDKFGNKKGTKVKVDAFSGMRDDWPYTDYVIQDEKGNQIGKFNWTPSDSGAKVKVIDDIIDFTTKPEVFWHDFKGYK